MSLRCGCPAEGDEIVFGPVHQCHDAPKPKPKRPKPGLLQRAWNLRPLDGLALNPPEPPYMETLDEAERTGH